MRVEHAREVDLAPHRGEEVCLRVELPDERLDLLDLGRLDEVGLVDDDAVGKLKLVDHEVRDLRSDSSTASVGSVSAIWSASLQMLQLVRLREATHVALVLLVDRIRVLAIREEVGGFEVVEEGEGIDHRHAGLQSDDTGQERCPMR